MRGYPLKIGQAAIALLVAACMVEAPEFRVCLLDALLAPLAREHFATALRIE
jgi:hypothetical protein